MNTDCLPMRNSDLRAREAARQEKPAHRAGFTLIEMLVVVIIISILAGMVLGLFKIAGVWAAKSQTNERLGKVRAAIEEFYAEYGMYPPVPVYSIGQPFYYEYPVTNGGLKAVANGSMNFSSPVPWNSCPIFTFGLMSFLVQRCGSEWGGLHAANIDLDSDFSSLNLFNQGQWTAYNTLVDVPGQGQARSDQSRDIAAVKRWKTHIQDVLSFGRAVHTPNSANVNATAAYTNLTITVLDGWNHELHYESAPPYQSYKLYAVAPDGTVISTGAGY